MGVGRSDIRIDVQNITLDIFGSHHHRRLEVLPLVEFWFGWPATIHCRTSIQASLHDIDFF